MNNFAGNHNGISTGFDAFDEMTGGLENGHVILLGSRPGMGKTLFGLSLVHNSCVKNGEPCIYFSSDLTRDQITAKIAALHAGISFDDISRNKDAKEKYNESIKAVENARLWIDEVSIINVSEIYKRCHQIYKSSRIGFIILDGLQLVTDDDYKSESKSYEIRIIMKGLKQLSLEIYCPIIVTTQLNKKVGNRRVWNPTLSDIPYYEDIMHWVDDVIILHREEDFSFKTVNGERIGFFFPKHGTAQGKTVQLRYVKEYPRFENMYGA